MFEVKKHFEKLQAWIAIINHDNAVRDIPFIYGDPESGNLFDYLTSVSKLYGDHQEFVSWNDDFQKFLHMSEFNLWLLVLQQPGRCGTVEYMLNFTKYNIYSRDEGDIYLSYQYYLDIVIGKTMLVFFTKYDFNIIMFTFLFSNK